MATVYKQRRLYPIPEGAEFITYRGKPYVKWTNPDTSRTERAALNNDGDRIIRESPFYVIEYFDHEQTRRRVVTRYADKDAAEQHAAKLERDAEDRRRGMIDPTQERYANEARRPIRVHLSDFRAFLTDKGNTAKHVDMTCKHVETIIESCKAERIGDLTGAAVMEAIGDLRDEDKSLRTCNAYLTSAKAFTKWLRNERRTPDDALIALAGFNADTDRRYIRREMSPEELAYFLATVEDYSTPMHNLPGPDRMMAYMVALGTGFRSKELRSLTPESFDLDTAPPTVTVQAAYSKRRKLDVQPIRRDLADLLRPWLEHYERDETPFANLPEATARMLRSDLAEARRRWLKEAKTDAQRKERAKSDFLQHTDAAGRVADFHALRHVFISAIVAGGASVKTAQELARHSTPVLTIGRYSHARLHDIQGALDALPDLRPQDPEAQNHALRATGTDGTGEPTKEGHSNGGDSAAHHAAQYNGKTWRETAENGQTEGEERAGDEEPKTLVFPGKTQENRGKTRRGAGGIRTPDRGFAIRCPSPETQGKTAHPDPGGAPRGALETKPERIEPDLQAVIDAWQDLPEAIKAGILAMIRAAGGS